MRLLMGGVLVTFAVAPLFLQADPPAAAPTTPATQPRVILLRGGLGVFSRGLDTLASRCRGAGLEAAVYPYSAWSSLAEQLDSDSTRRPLVLVGHSFGADAVLALAARLEQRGVPVELAITLETINPTRVPENIARTLNVYSGRTTNSLVPFWRGLPLPGNGKVVENINLLERTDLASGGAGHANIDDSGSIHGFILAEIRKLDGQGRAEVRKEPGEPPPSALGAGTKESTTALRIATSPAVTPSKGGPLQIAAPATEQRGPREGAFSPSGFAWQPPESAVVQSTTPSVPARPTARTVP